MFVAISEKAPGTCFKCSIFSSYTFLPSGDAALTRRSKKHSDHCGVLLFWNQRRKRFDRKGQYVQVTAIQQAKAECQADAQIRAKRNEKAAKQRIVQDKKYINDFASAIHQFYPGCPPAKTTEIANHACEKHSGRVGRTAAAKTFDRNMIDLAVEAHIRHHYTNYDEQFGKGKRKKQIRSEVKFDIQKILNQWKKRP